MVEQITVIAVIGILAILLLPAGNRMLKNAKKSQAISDLRTVGAAVGIFQSDHDGRYPASSGPGAVAPYWTDLIAPYLPGPRPGTDYNGIAYKLSPALISPLLPRDRHHRMGDFGANGAIFLRALGPGDTPIKWRSAANPLPAAAVLRPSQTVLVMTAETASVTPPVGSWYVNTSLYATSPDAEMLRPSDQGTGFVLGVFADGHTEAVPLGTFTQDRKKYLVPSE